MTISNDKRNGFTLIEVLIVTFMIGLVTASVYSLYNTSQRSSYAQEEVVDVQQNLRIAMDSISRDIRHAGFLTSEIRDMNFTDKGFVGSKAALNGNTIQPINSALNLAGTFAAPPGGPLPNTADAFPGQPVAVHADSIIINSASPSATFAKIAQTMTIVNGTAPFTVTVMTAGSIDNFNNNEFVRIINTTRHRQATAGQGTIYQITGMDRSVPSMTLQWAQAQDPTGTDPTDAELKRDYIIAKISSVNFSYPAAIQYCLGPSVSCPAPAATCPNMGANDRTLCLVRRENGVASVIASRIAGLQLIYLLDNGASVSNAGIQDLGAIRAVRVTLTGQTAVAGALSGGDEKTRTMSAVVRLHNRWLDY